MPAGLLDTSCTEVATLAEVLARGACVFRTRVWARAASTALDAAIALHRLDAALADLLDADNAEDEWRAA